MVSIPIWIVLLAVVALLVMARALFSVVKKCRELKYIVKNLEGEVEEEKESGSGDSEGNS